MLLFEFEVADTTNVSVYSMFVYGFQDAYSLDLPPSLSSTWLRSKLDILHATCHYVSRSHPLFFRLGNYLDQSCSRPLNDGMQSKHEIGS